MLLAISVVVVRTYVTESYLIHTGSMAPTLLGYHKRLSCPNCKYEFVRGNAHDRNSDQTSYAMCPNCGFTGIDFAGVDQSLGDQLLIHKFAYEFHQPDRWNVVVFRNPHELSPAYVKRVVGLPGERVEIRDGNVFINGEIQRKPLDVQRAMRILVFDQSYEPEGDPDWRPRWVIMEGTRGWSKLGTSFHFLPHNQATKQAATGDIASSPTEIEWVNYRHWIRRDGSHVSGVKLKNWPGNLYPPETYSPDLKYSRVERRLVHKGALSFEAYRKLLTECDEEEFHDKLTQLYEKTHLAPLTDVLGYNRVESHNDIHELMLTLELEHAHQGEFRVELTDSVRCFELVINLLNQKLKLLDADSGEVLRTGILPDGKTSDIVNLEISLFDQQCLVAIDHQPSFEPYAYERTSEQLQPLTQPVRLGARGGLFAVRNLRLFRDVHYTHTESEHDEGVWELRDDELFVLGDNTAASVDSRYWEAGTVTPELLIGKPLVLHLPSKPVHPILAGKEWTFRMPDFDRMGLIR